MSTMFTRLALAASLALAITGCNKDDATTAAVAPAAVKAPASPEGSVTTAVQNLKAGNIDALIQGVLPAGEYTKLKTEWATDVNKEPVTEEDRAKFVENMTKLTAPDAEAKLWTELEPQLKQMDAQMAQQMPMMVAMGKGFVQSAIQQNQELNDAQKTQATQAVDAFGNWVTTAKFTDPALAQKAIKTVCDTARKINLKTIDEARALNYEQAMQKAGLVFLGLKDVLNIYGFSIDQTLDSVKATSVSNDGTNAKVKIEYTLFNTPLSAESELVKVDDRWYGKQTLEALKKKNAADAAAPATPAPAAADPQAPATKG
ncbi:MAG: hypothetical protein ABI411_03370 [Tahibacter sp.]